MEDLFLFLGLPTIIGLIIGFGARSILNTKNQDNAIMFITISTISSFMFATLGYINSLDFDLGASVVLSIFGSLIGISLIYVLTTSNRPKRKQTTVTNKKLKESNPYSEIPKVNRIKPEKKNTLKKTTKFKIPKNEIIELKDSIGKNKIEHIIEEMKNKFKNNNLSDDNYNDLIIIESRYHQLQSSSRKGVLTRDDETLEENKIRNSLLSLIDSMSNT